MAAEILYLFTAMKQFDTGIFVGLFRMQALLLFMLCFNAPASSQSELRFSATVSEKQLSLNQPFQVQFVLYGAGGSPEIQVPAINGFRLHDSFTNQSSQVTGGQKLKWIDSYARVLVLSATRTGKLTIPAATVTIDGKTLRTKPVQVTVSQTGLASVPEHIEQINEPVVQDESELQPGESIEEKTRKNFFLRANTNKTTCYVGEPLDVNYKAYSRLNSNSQVVKRPSFPGFSVVEMVESYNNKPEIEVINGEAFYTNLIRRVQLFPLQAGTYELDPAEIETVIHFVKTVRPGSEQDLPSNEGESRLQRLLDRAVRGNSYRTNFDHFTTLKTPPVKIEVKPLPEEGQPADFSGAVGKFTLNTKMPAEEIKQGELIHIRWELAGSGNLQLATLPDVEWPRGIDTSEPSVKEDINQFIYPLSGKKTFDYAVTARDTGSYTIPPVSFSYFDPQSATYKTIVTEPVRFHVSPNKNMPFSAAEDGSGSVNQPLHLYWFGGIALAIIAWVIYQLVRPGTKEIKSLIPSVPPTETVAVKQLFNPELSFANARKSLANDDAKGFHRELQQVLWTLAAGRCDVLPSYLNKQNISFQLQKQQVPATVINNLLTILNECEWALYTPEHIAADMEELLERAVEVSKQVYQA